MNIWRAVGRGETERVKELLNQGINPNLKGTNGWTLLMEASKEKHLDVMEILIKAGTDVNERDIHGQSALLSAAYYGDNEIVEFLVQKGADVNLEDIDYATPLSDAVSQGFKDISYLLLKNGAKVNSEIIRKEMRRKNILTALKLLTYFHGNESDLHELFRFKTYLNKYSA